MLKILEKEKARVHMVQYIPSIDPKLKCSTKIKYQSDQIDENEYTYVPHLIYFEGTFMCLPNISRPYAFTIVDSTSSPRRLLRVRKRAGNAHDSKNL